MKMMTEKTMEYVSSVFLVFVLSFYFFIYLVNTVISGGSFWFVILLTLGSRLESQRFLAVLASEHSEISRTKYNEHGITF